MNDLLKEAIADAKAVRTTALANAKLALEEAFTPKLQSMISAKIREEAEHDDVDEMSEELPGLNFLTDSNLDKNFLLLCGFEKFREFFVRIDILEKLFLKIIDNTKDKKFKINAEMMNLLGCSKEKFYKLMTYMNYKKDKTADTYIFKGEKKRKEKIIRFDKKENPFNKLLSLNIK